MSDPADIPRKRKKPQRAEPLQPDLPGRGNERLASDDGAAPPAEDNEASERQKSQSDDALDNVGHGRP